GRSATGRGGRSRCRWAVFAYCIEWGTRMALIYSGESPPPVDAADMPHWEWGQTPPWQPEPPQHSSE
ncbi:hypothetical protein AB0K74_37160, partial [Streptomyces sp. NPDC056159]